MVYSPIAPDRARSTNKVTRRPRIGARRRAWSPQNAGAYCLNIRRSASRLFLVELDL